MGYLIFASKILLAILLGGVLGWQRERIGKAAGPRTYALVSAGSALFTLLSINAFGGVESARVASQVVTGIGFIGAGLIIHKGRGTVEGLTTAAGMWAVAAIGMAVGAGWYLEAIIVMFLLFVVFVFDDNRLSKSAVAKDESKD